MTFSRLLDDLIRETLDVSLPAFALAGLRRGDPRAAEAALKFFLVSVVSTAVTLMGISLLYGATGAVFLDHLAAAVATGTGPRQVLVVGALLTVVGLAFKVAAVPFHMWVPDTYTGAPVAVAAYLSVVSKTAGFAGLVMVLEPLNWYANHPGLFLRSVPQAYAICKGVASPSCKILDDLYHQQIDVGNLIPNMEMAWDEIAYIQVGDNPGRKEPTTGEINYKKIFEWLYKKKFDGVVGMEHGNAKPGKEGEMALIAAYRECDNF